MANVPIQYFFNLILINFLKLLEAGPHNYTHIAAETMTFGFTTKHEDAH